MTTVANTAVEPAENHERARLPARRTKGGDHFAALYSAEHVAGGEFVVGVAFASWGASPSQVLWGLIIGNLLAVLCWALVCSPVATRTRMTLYYYLERLAGKKLTSFYNILNGVIFAVIAGGMITISASAFNALMHGAPQIQWYPTSIVFVVIALLIGAVMTMLALRGFDGLSKISKLCAPWLMTIFVVSGLASLPFLLHAGGTNGLGFTDVFGQFVWTGKTPDGSASFSIWQIAAFAWGLNLPLHLGMGDMSTLRFAKDEKYGYYSAFAAFGGHFMAWVACGILGATTALILKTDIRNLDIGGVVLPILGLSGIGAVVVASLTTAVPSFYRACLAMNAISPKFSYKKVTIALGVIVSLFACLPLIFLKWLDIMAYFNIALAPIGAVIFVEHFILPKMGIRPLWRELTTQKRNNSALIVWGIGIALAAILVITNVMHLFFVFIWVYLACMVAYLVLAKGEAKSVQKQGVAIETLYTDAYGQDDLTELHQAHQVQASDKSLYKKPTFLLAMVALIAMIVASMGGFFIADPATYQATLRWILAALSACYFAFMIMWNGWQ